MSWNNLIDCKLLIAEKLKCNTVIYNNISIIGRYACVSHGCINAQFMHTSWRDGATVMNADKCICLYFNFVNLRLNIKKIIPPIQ